MRWLSALTTSFLIAIAVPSIASAKCTFSGVLGGTAEDQAAAEEEYEECLKEEAEEDAAYKKQIQDATEESQSIEPDTNEEYSGQTHHMECNEWVCKAD